MTRAWEGLPEAERQRRFAEGRETMRQLAETDPLIAGMQAELRQNARKYRIEKKLSRQYLIEHGFKPSYGDEFVKGEIIVYYGSADIMHCPGFWFSVPQWFCMADGKEFLCSCEAGHVKYALAELYEQIAETLTDDTGIFDC